jgi:hypothetical protein
MKSLLTALVLTAASVLPVSAGIHDFKPSNVAPVSKPPSRCYTTEDNSQVCWQREGSFYAAAIYDVDHPGQATTVVMDCSTGKWRSYGALSKEVTGWYMSEFCNNN